MKLAKRAYVITLLLLMLAFTVTAQKDLKSEKDNRNTSPTVGTGGPVGGPTGLFTVYDQETLRKGEYTFSFLLSVVPPETTVQPFRARSSDSLPELTLLCCRHALAVALIFFPVLVRPMAASFRA